MHKLSIFFLALLPAVCFSQKEAVQKKYFEYSESSLSIYSQIFDLKLEQASNGCQKLKANEPGNLVYAHLENYIDLLLLYNTVDKDLFDHLEENKSIRIDQIKSGPKDSPYYLYLQSEIYLQWAFIKMKYQEYLSAFSDVSKAFKLIKQNQAKFPDFKANKKNLGVIHGIVGTVPENYRWGLKLLGGLEGDLAQGKRELKELCEDDGFIFQEESQVLFAVLTTFFSGEEKIAFHNLQDWTRNNKQDLLMSYVMSKVALKSGNSSKALNILEDINYTSNGYQLNEFDLLKGLSLLYALEEDADQYLLRYIKNQKGGLYKKYAYQKLSWYSLINGQQNQYQKYNTLCLSEGNAETVLDKNAFKEASSGSIPHQELLKARLLFDGGYYFRALELLEKPKFKKALDFPYSLEYLYRYARTLDNSGNKDAALDFYQQTISLGKSHSLFYACNAALQSGFIYEKNRQYLKAKQQFQLCLSMRPDQYKNSLHQKAEAGLERIKVQIEN